VRARPLSRPRGPALTASNRRFRLGLILYVPVRPARSLAPAPGQVLTSGPLQVYLLFPELRGLVGDGDKVGLVMLGMIVLSAIRYLANACAYTAVVRRVLSCS